MGAYMDENRDYDNVFVNDKKVKKGWRKTLRFAAGSAVFGMVFGFGVLTWSQEGIEKNGAEPAAVERQIEVALSESAGGETAAAELLSSIGKTNLGNVSSTVIDVSDIVEESLPSVVAVNCVTYVQGSNMFTYGFYNYGNSSSMKEQNSCGTGIIIGESDESLMILTNNHVIENTDKVSVVFSDGTEVGGSVLGSDADADVAIVLIPLSDIPEQTRSVIKIAALGDSDKVKVGSAAIAIGNALGYGQSVTTGVISAVNREVNLTDKTMTLIQTDAAINQGNSGGPLLNASGEVIGINTVKYAASGVEGMCYAIPITDAKPIIESIVNGTSTNDNGQEQQEARLGIYGMDVPEQIQRLYQMPEGIYVYGVVENSPAQRYNIQEGSVIVAIDGQSVTGMEDLTEALKQRHPGDTMSVTMALPGYGQYMEETVQVVLDARVD